MQSKKAIEFFFFFEKKTLSLSYMSPIFRNLYAKLTKNNVLHLRFDEKNSIHQLALIIREN